MSTETKHTKGPWAIGRYHNYIGFSIWGDDRGCIAERWYDKEQLPPYGDELTANAYLISAAPELLEACRTFEQWLRREEAGLTEEQHKMRGTPEGEAEWRSWFYENMRLCDLAQRQARAAISKATGGAL